MAATFAAMMLLYALFSKFVPIISIWELKAGLTSCTAPQAVEAADADAHSRRVRAIAPEGARMKAIYGLYADPHVAQQAVDNLRAGRRGRSPTSR